MTRHSSWIGANMKPTAFHPGRIAKHQKDVFPGRLTAGSTTVITHEKKGKWSEPSKPSGELCVPAVNWLRFFFPGGVRGEPFWSMETFRWDDMLSEPSEVGRCGFANSQLSTWQGGDSCEQTTQGGSPEGWMRLETTPDRLDEVYLPIGFLPIFSSTKFFEDLWENTMRKGLQQILFLSNHEAFLVEMYFRPFWKCWWLVGMQFRHDTGKTHTLTLQFLSPEILGTTFSPGRDCIFTGMVGQLRNEQHPCYPVMWGF